MTSPRLAAAFLAATAVCAVLPVLQPAPAAADEHTESPLTIELARLTPSTVPDKGRIVMAGTVRNDSEETWTAINVHPFLSETPMTDREQLSAAAKSDPTIEIGTRLLAIGQFAPIGDLAPGQVAPFRISLKVSDLPIAGTPGVYWIGVHALGQNAEGRDTFADGRARTFIPLVPDDVESSVALVVPIRDRVRRDPVGKLLDTSRWSETLRDDGRLERIAALMNTSGGLPTTLLIDPAVIDAVASVAADNPALSLGEEPEDTPTESPSESPGSSPGATVSPSRALNRLGPTDRANAARWLAQVRSAATLQDVLGLGYADPDTAALARRRPALISLAAKESAAAFKGLEVDMVPAVAPPSGWLDDEALEAIDADTTVLVSDHSAPRTRSQWRTPDDQNLVFTDDEASSGGPGPTEPLAALAVRQRIVSDAALRAVEGLRSPMVVAMPANWNPGAQWQSADFFGGINLPWLDLVGVTPPSDESPPTFDAVLGYPASQRREEIGLANVAAARTLVTTANVMGALLRSTNDAQHGLTRIALDAVSYHARRDPGRAREQVLATDETMRSRLDRVSVIGTDFVTLSGGSGTLTVTLANELDQPITVGIRPRASSPDVHIETPEPFEMAPGQRTVLRLRAEASAIGVHAVTLTPVTADGVELGTPLTFNLRTSQVGKLIWGVLLGGGGLLVVMILRRILRGIREHRWRGQ